MKAVIDIIALSGLGSICYGAYLIYPPLVYILSGFMAVYIAVKLNSNTTTEDNKNDNRQTIQKG